MKSIRWGGASLVAVLLATHAVAQTVNEVEPNSSKSEATSAMGLAAGATLNGSTTGTTTTAGSTLLTSVDTFRVGTSALPLGIYRHSLTVSTGFTGNILGRTQTNGVVAAGSEATFQVGSAQTNAWYGFGKQEELYYRVTGSTTTTAPYVATLATTPVTPIAVPGTLNPGPITITTAGQGHTNDTEIYLYDANLNPVAGGHNDDLTGGIAGPSTLNVTLAAGTYYVAVSNYNTANDQSDLNAAEAYDDGNVLDFPDVVANQSTSTTTNVAFALTDSIVTRTVPATHAAIFDVVWATFTVAIDTNPPANDACANARVIGNGSFSGYLTFASNDGSAACDSGGAASHDVWFSYTNSTTSGLILSANTCGSTFDTTLAAFNGCGGPLLVCNDTCTGGACGSPSSCLTTPIAPGQTVILRVSDKGLAGGFFNLNVSAGIPGDECALPMVLAGPGTFPIDNTLATTGTAGQTESLCLFAVGTTAINNDLWFNYTPTANATVTVSTCGLISGGPTQDSKIAVYSGAGCPTAGTAIACNDDAACTGFSGLNATVSFPASCGTTYTIQIGTYSGTTARITGNVSVTETGGSSCSTPVTYFCFGDGTGLACPCANSGAVGNGCANSLNPNGGNLTASGNAALSLDTWTITGSGIPNGPGLYYQALNQLGGGNGVVFGDGIRCIGGTVIRLGIVTAVGNTSSYPSPNPPAVNGIPISVKGFNSAGDVRNYQLWYRDSTIGFCSANVFNLTNAVNVTWIP